MTALMMMMTAAMTMTMTMTAQMTMITWNHADNSGIGVFAHRRADRRFTFTDPPSPLLRARGTHEAERRNNRAVSSPYG